MENSIEVTQKFKVELSNDPAILRLGVALKKPEILIGKNICTPMFITVLFTIASLGSNPSAHRLTTG